MGVNETMDGYLTKTKRHCYFGRTEHYYVGIKSFRRAVFEWIAPKKLLRRRPLMGQDTDIEDRRKKGTAEQLRIQHQGPGAPAAHPGRTTRRIPRIQPFHRQHRIEVVTVAAGATRIGTEGINRHPRGGHKTGAGLKPHPVHTPLIPVPLRPDRKPVPRRIQRHLRRCSRGWMAVLVCHT